MEAAALGMLLARPHQRTMSDDSTTNIQRKPNKPSVENNEDVSKEQKQQRSRSWLAPLAPRRNRSIRRISAATAPPPPPVPIVPLTPTSTSSRRSYDSDGASQSSKALSNMSSEATTVDLMEEPLTPAWCPPRRPQRPREGLFESAIPDSVDQWIEIGTEPGQGMMRLSSQFHDSVTGDQGWRASSRAISPDVYELMREADLAYEAVGAALTETKTASSYSYASNFPDAAASPPFVPGRHQSRRPAIGEWSESALPLKGSTIPTTSSESEKSKWSSHMTTKSESRLPARPSRWTLTDNMAEAFRTQRTKTDRKPMTPSLIEAIWNGQDNGRASNKRKEKEEDKKNKATPNSSRLTEPARNSAPDVCQTLRLEPFHNPNPVTSPTLMSSADVRMRAIPFEIAIPPLPSSVLRSPEIIHHNISSHWSPSDLEESKEPNLNADTQSDEQTSNTGTIEATEVTEVTEISEVTEVDELHLTPPPKNPARFRVRAPTMPQLPPIPEGFRAIPSKHKSLQLPVAHRRSQSLNQALEMKDEYVQLTSTPFTLTNPAFRHGPIILNDRGREEGETAEEDVDWAAFHSAILGGAGEDFAEFFPEQKSRRDDEEESNIADEVTAWFEEFGFETHGELIASELPSQRDSDRSSQRNSAGSITSAFSSPSTVQTDSGGELETPVGSQHVFDTIRMLRDTYSASIYTIDTVDAPWEPTVVDGEVGQGSIDEPAVMSAHAKPDMDWVPHFLQWKADRPY